MSFEKNRSKYPVRPCDFYRFKLICPVPNNEPLVVYGKSMAEAQRNLIKSIKANFDHNAKIDELSYKVEELTYE
jgi:hypothetical protein